MKHFVGKTKITLIYCLFIYLSRLKVYLVKYFVKQARFLKKNFRGTFSVLINVLISFFPN